MVGGPGQSGRRCGTLLLHTPKAYCLCVRNIILTLVNEWSYGDSNPRPLACHSVATRPPECICAGHPPRTCMRVRTDPGPLRYFAAVRIAVTPPAQAPQPDAGIDNGPTGPVKPQPFGDPSTRPILPICMSARHSPASPECP